MLVIVSTHSSTSISTSSYKRVTSVQIRLREGECVFDQLNARFGTILDDYLHHIESENDVRVLEHAQPGERAARNSLLFCTVNRFQWPAEIFAGSRFHFYEHERVVIATHHIDFAAAASAEIAEQNFVTATLQESARQFLPVRAAP